MDAGDYGAGDDGGSTKGGFGNGLYDCRGRSLRLYL